MKVLFLTNIPSPYRVDFFNEMGKLCDLTVLYERGNAEHRDDAWLSKKSSTFNEVFLKSVKIKKGVFVCPSVTKYLKKDDYDVIVVGGYSTPTGILAIEYCRLNDIPFILNADGGLVGSERKMKYRIKKHFISSADAWLTTSDMTTEYLLHYGADKDQIYPYPFTSISQKDIVDLSSLDEDKLEARKKVGIEDKPTVIAVGQFIHRKGFDTLIDSWVNISSSYNLIIIGGGEKKNNLEEQIKKLNLSNVKLLDFKAEGLSDYYRACDLFVLPTREDVWGLVINEAMAHGLPVITTNKCIAGLELIKENENGFIINAEDNANLTKRITEILDNPKLSRNIKANNVEKIKSHTIENMAKAHLEIFNSVTIKKRLDNYYIYQ